MEILNSKIYGSELSTTPVLVFHGLFGMLDNWGSFGKALGEHFPVHLIDLRNHGKSFHSEQISHDLMAEDIRNYMEHYQISKVILLGHSLGGKAVMQFAMLYPELLEKLIVVDMGPKAYPPHHQAILKALNSVDFQPGLSRQEVEAILESHGLEKSVIQFLAKNLTWKEKGLLSWRFNLKVLTEKYQDLVGNPIKNGVYEGPTLFVKGEKSNYLLPQDSFQIKQQFPNSKLVEVPRAGHWVQSENPVDFNKEVFEFLGIPLRS